MFSLTQMCKKVIRALKVDVLLNVYLVFLNDWNKINEQNVWAELCSIRTFILRISIYICIIQM